MQLMTATEVCKELKISRSTLYRMIKQKELNPIILNERGDRRFKQEDVENYLDGLRQAHNDLDK